nr:hypothetical protein [Tanacetum cinerariifolium]
GEDREKKGLENANAAQQLEIVKLKARVKKLERLNKIKSSKLRRLKKPAVKPKVLKFAAAAPAVSTRKRKGVDDTPAETLSMKDKGKGILVEDPKPIKKKDQIEMDAEYAKRLQEEELEKGHKEAYKNIDWNTAFDHFQAKDVHAKETQYIKRYHGFKKKPQSASEARKNMIAYLKNTKEMEKEDKEIIKSINETPAQKAAKKRKQNEEAQKQRKEAQRLSEEAQKKTDEAQEADDLKGHLEIVPNKDDDVFVEAVPLAQKALIVDYQVVVMDKKPKYKIIRAGDTHQFYISFITLLKNFDRKDLETLWRIVKDRFSIKKPTNFLDEYLLLTLKTMFGELDA